MKTAPFRVFGLLPFLCLAGCMDDGDGQAPIEKDNPPQTVLKEPTPAQVVQKEPTPTEIVLPASVKPVSDSKPYFGIEISSLDQQQAAVVRSAWQNYERVLAGTMPDCAVESMWSDGGSITYDCDGYELMRVKSLSLSGDKDGYDYGASLDFLNGNEVRRVRFVTRAEMKRLEASAR